MYRLNALTIELPPLRERGEDLDLLIDYFFETISGEMELEDVRLSPEARHRLRNHRWEGNVRELKNTIRSSLATAGNRILSSKDLSLEEESETKTPGYPEESLPDKVLQFEVSVINRTIEECGGNKSRAAEQLGITRQTLFNKLKKFEKKNFDQS